MLQPFLSFCNTIEAASWWKMRKDGYVKEGTGLHLLRESYILAVMLLLSRLYAPPIEVKNSDAWYSA